MYTINYLSMYHSVYFQKGSYVCIKGNGIHYGIFLVQKTYIVVNNVKFIYLICYAENQTRSLCDQNVWSARPTWLDDAGR